MSKSQTSRHFDDAAQHYAERDWVGSDSILSQIGAFVGELRANGPILELGIGTGAFSKILAEENELLIGLDISMEMMKRIPSRSTQIALVHADAHYLPFHSDVFGVVASRNMLRHIENPAQVLSEIRRVARDGAWMLLAENCALNAEEQTFLNQLISLSEPYQRPFLLSSELNALFDAAGFLDIRSTTFPYLQHSTRQYFRTHYHLREETIDELWRLYHKSTSTEQLSNIVIRQPEDSFVLNSHWSVIVARCT